MDRNVGKIDQVVRIVLGVSMLSLLVFVPESGWWGLLGLAPIFTGTIGYCPGYRLLGIRTNRAPADDPA